MTLLYVQNASELSIAWKGYSFFLFYYFFSLKFEFNPRVAAYIVVNIQSGDRKIYRKTPWLMDQTHSVWPPFNLIITVWAHWSNLVHGKNLRIPPITAKHQYSANAAKTQKQKATSGHVQGRAKPEESNQRRLASGSQSHSARWYGELTAVESLPSFGGRRICNDRWISLLYFGFLDQ